MEVRIIDFGVITKHYKTYREGMNLINLERQSFLEDIKPLKKEIQKTLLENAQRGIRDVRSNNLEDIQKEMIEIEKDYNDKIKVLYDDTNVKVFDELQVIIGEWATNNSIDLVSSKMEVIFNTDRIEATNDILNILRDKGLFVELETENKEEDSTSL